MPEINPVTKEQLFEKKIAENTGSDYNVGDISDVVPVTKDQALLKEIALNSAGQSGDIIELNAKIGNLSNLETTAKNNLVAAINETKNYAAHGRYNNQYDVTIFETEVNGEMYALYVTATGLVYYKGNIKVWEITV